MIDSYILRAHTDDGMRFLEETASLIKRELGASVEIIDHRKPDPIDFGIGTFKIAEPFHISLDQHLAEIFNIPYFQISRVFNENGDVVNRLIGNASSITKNIFYEKTVHIIDTDMVHGETLKLAMKIFNANFYTIPIRINHNQDLIDMEDLSHRKSYLKISNGLDTCSYLLNPVFFSKRTSLPEHLLRPMAEIFYSY